MYLTEVGSKRLFGDASVAGLPVILGERIDGTMVFWDVWDAETYQRLGGYVDSDCFTGTDPDPERIAAAKAAYLGKLEVVRV
jgi:hypothetical protein